MLNGSNFGPTARKLASLGPNQTTTAQLVNLTFTNPTSGLTINYLATECRVLGASNLALSCVLPEGVGAGFTWTLRVGASAIGEELSNAMRSTNLRFTSIPPDAFKRDVTAHDSQSGESEGSLPHSTPRPRRELKRGLTQSISTAQTISSEAASSARNLLNRAVTGLLGEKRRVTHVRTLSERTLLSLSLLPCI